MEEGRSDSRRQEPMVARADNPQIPADESDDEFEFSFGSREPATGGAAADELFADGRIRPFYPVFGRVFDDASSPARSPRKSGSTGSLSRWRRVSDLVVGRSRSDGRDKFGFLSAPPSPAREQPKAKPRGRDSKAATELDTVAASHRLFYGAKASPGATRRTFLPYRQDLVGLFSTPKGLSRSQYF
ncbi:unnamed protein product [Triticum turgidum subsp. durum]|uniref:Uncharacterized protein n=1 Tax=Triticum turgidum subsp. durum TaxID=4567 RepID=A0A9R1QI51_TRITD|nr:unnamed protein product [Triticum turgidum subsp. durum]